MAMFSTETQPGDTVIPVQLGMCLGGLVTTWSTLDPQPHLWAVLDDGLPELMYEGKISKVARSDGLSNRYREAAMLDTHNKMLYVTVEGEDAPREFHLGGPTDISPKDTWFDLGMAMNRAIAHTAKQPGGVLLLELGGLTAPAEPFALFTTEGSETFSKDGVSAIVETRPSPLGSTAWAPYLKPGDTGAVLRSPLNDHSRQMSGLMLVDAARTWGVSPWDLALTFGSM